MINTTRILSLMRLLKVQVQSQDCPWLWQGKGLGFWENLGKLVRFCQVLLLHWKYPVFFFSRQVAIRDLAVELRAVVVLSMNQHEQACGECIWNRNLINITTLPENNANRRYLIDDISVAPRWKGISGRAFFWCSCGINCWIHSKATGLFAGRVDFGRRLWPMHMFQPDLSHDASMQEVDSLIWW